MDLLLFMLCRCMWSTAQTAVLLPLKLPTYAAVRQYIADHLSTAQHDTSSKLAQAVAAGAYDTPEAPVTDLSNMSAADDAIHETLVRVARLVSLQHCWCAK